MGSIVAVTILGIALLPCVMEYVTEPVGSETREEEFVVGALFCPEAE